MAEQTKTKLNRLLQILPEGWLAPSHWLAARGYTRALLAYYSKHGWLRSPAHGVYQRPGTQLKWQHVVVSLQRLERLPMHVGGRTALVHRGLAHYLRLGGPEEIHLYGPSTDGLPAWTRKLEFPEKLVAHNDAMFSSLPRAYRDESGHFLDNGGRRLPGGILQESGLSEFSWEGWDWTITYSTEERAILEILQDVPARESVYEADVLMQGLVNLRPQRLMMLLKACSNVKVKRLFLALAERHHHSWFKHLDIDAVDRGRGKRMLVPGGRLHPRFLITLPSDLDDHAR
ncbi:MAG TPA: type IV toxin-antitoxin system AbiEi family antitoxin domain-containing protein [Candidatus Binatia bacterium]|nr:type IV toxin-antitoxin system AbiEi family antitoxin domain-containing protein [Candidatus Binatia bacterium]